QRPAVDVIEIEPDPILKIAHLIAAADLPETSQSRLHAETAALRGVLEFLHFVERQWTRPDQTHVSDEDVPKLRQLIKTCPPQPAAERRDPRIGFHFEHRAAHL